MPEQTTTKDWRMMLVNLENKLEEVFSKAPQLPENAKEFIVKYGPYITIVLMVLSLPALGLMALALFSVGGILSIIAMVMEVIALPGLFKRQVTGWKWLFYSSLVSALSSIVSFNIGALLIGALVSWYILFQIKSYYK